MAEKLERLAELDADRAALEYLIARAARGEVSDPSVASRAAHRLEDVAKRVADLRAEIAEDS